MNLCFVQRITWFFPAKLSRILNIEVLLEDELMLEIYEVLFYKRKPIAMTFPSAGCHPNWIRPEMHHCPYPFIKANGKGEVRTQVFSGSKKETNCALQINSTAPLRNIRLSVSLQASSSSLQIKPEIFICFFPLNHRNFLLNNKILTNCISKVFSQHMRHFSLLIMRCFNQFRSTLRVR